MPLTNWERWTSMKSLARTTLGEGAGSEPILAQTNTIQPPAESRALIDGVCCLHSKLALDSEASFRDADLPAAVHVQDVVRGCGSRVHTLLPFSRLHSARRESLVAISQCRARKTNSGGTRRVDRAQLIGLVWGTTGVSAIGLIADLYKYVHDRITIRR